jgi:hypothetical protein
VSPFAKFFYPRIRYSSPIVTLDFDDPAGMPMIDDGAERGQNVSEGGVTETLFVRGEPRLRLRFVHLKTAKLAEVYTWWTSHARLGKQSEIILDRLSTCAGQWEYDQFNTHFTRGVLLNNPFAPRRDLGMLAQYGLELLFRQDTA